MEMEKSGRKPIVSFDPSCPVPRKEFFTDNNASGEDARNAIELVEGLKYPPERGREEVPYEKVAEWVWNQIEDDSDEENNGTGEEHDPIVIEDEEDKEEEEKKMKGENKSDGMMWESSKERTKEGTKEEVEERKRSQEKNRPAWMTRNKSSEKRS